MDDFKNSDFDVEREKVMIEREKLQIERERLKLERFKSWWTSASIIIPIVVAATGIAFSVWSLNQQARTQSAIQAQQAKSQFEIKAAEIVMSSEGPIRAHAKAKALAELFPDRLPENFAASFEPERYLKSQETTSRSGDSNIWGRGFRPTPER